MTVKSAIQISAYIAFIALAACSRGTVDSDLIASKDGSNNIARTYEVAYSEESGRSYASATFNVANDWYTTVKLKGPAKIMVNGVAMLEDTDILDGGEVGAFYAGFLFPPAWLMMGASGTSYSVPLHASTYQFVWTDQTGRVFTDVVQWTPFYLSAPGSFTKSQGATITVAGATDADIYLRLRQGTVVTSTVGRGSSVTLPASDLARLSAGASTLEVEVQQRRDLPAGGNAGGQARLVYKFSPRNVQLF